MNTELYDALKKLREHIPRLADILKLGVEAEIGFWIDIVDAKLLSRLAPDFPVVAAICGGGSSGKSTLFNSLARAHISPTGGTAGINRRVLMSIPTRQAGQTDFLVDLARPFKDVPEPLQDAEELTQPGKPLFVENPAALKNMVIVDTPDFDTGARGAYTNREVTRMALEASDIFIYIFTNSNYNNRDNTDFIAQMLTGIGKRKCLLVYRVYPSYTPEEVLAHARTVAEGIYGKSADQYLLGVYRTDEDNGVAAGDRFMAIRPVDAKEPEFLQTLQSINTSGIRLELFSSILKDVVQRAETISSRSQVALDELRLYLDAFQVAQSQSVREALKNFPINHLMRRFARIWAATDPTHVKIMRRTGTVIEFPIKMLLGAAGWAKDQMSLEKPGPSSDNEYAQKVDEDLVTAVTGLYSQTVSPQLAVSSAAKDPLARRMADAVDIIRARKKLAKGKNPRTESSGDGLSFSFLVDAPPVVHPEQELLRSRDFKSVLQSILAEKETILGISQDMEADLKNLADDFRQNMGLWRKINQTFWAFLNVLPATVAVTYVLSTGDPVGGAGIKVKLAGLFGAKDLYALFAIPFTTGLKKADRQQIEEMLQVILHTWLKDKSKIVQDLFEQNLSGGIIRCARRQIAAADQLINNINDSLLLCDQGDLKK
jgi:energy-coupling factor transporter ATP-binding protein EcfA2